MRGRRRWKRNQQCAQGFGEGDHAYALSSGAHPGERYGNSSAVNANSHRAYSTDRDSHIPPLRTIDEEVTGELVGNISANEFPRTNARVLERSFRREEGFAEANIGKSFLIQGNVIVADRRDDGVAFVEFKAGNGKVTCEFEVISDPELRRFSPDGTNAVTGTVAAWDPETRLLEVENCRVVLGF